jgi:dihydrofolate reductase
VSYSDQMSVVAFLVLGKDGSSTLHGSSAGITSDIDRQSFLQARRLFDCIIIGGQSAQREPYSTTPIPLVVVSRSRPSVVERNPQAHWWNCRPAEALSRAIDIFGPKICVEGGINFLQELMNENLIDELHLSLTSVSGGENRADYNELLQRFSDVTQSKIDDTEFFLAKSPRLKTPK